MAVPAAVLSILVKANTGQATTGLLRINQQLGSTEKGSQRAAKAVSSLVKGLALAGGAGAVAGIGFAVKKAADFEAQLSSLGSVADANAKQMERFRKQALKAGADTKFSALEAAQAQTELAKGGLSVAQISKGGLRSALALAAAGEMELADAAGATVNAMKLFGLRGRDSMKVADGFATAANRTTADVADFAMALKMGGSAAKAAGLDFTETTVALEALAEIGIRGSDAGTSLKAMLVQLAAPTAKQRELTKKLNIDFFDQQGNMKSLTAVSRMLRDRMGDLTKEQQLQTVKTLAGTDGMRAMLALVDAGPKKLAAMGRELNKEGTAAEVAKRKQDNLKGSLEQLGGSVETLGIQVGSMMIPAFRRAADELTDFANDVGEIVARDDLSLGEKLQKSLDLAQVRAKPWIDKLASAIEAANLPERIGGVISAATPIIAGAAARAAPIVVAAFIKGWLAADVWGRLAIGGWLLARMGGPPAFMRMGGAAGIAMGRGMAPGVAAGMATGTGVGAVVGGAVAKQTIQWSRGPGGAMLATVGTAMGTTTGKAMGPAVAATVGGSGLKSKLAGLARGWGPILALGVAATFGPELIRLIDEKAHPATAGGLPKTGDALSKVLRETVKGFKVGDLLDPIGFGQNIGQAIIGKDTEKALRQFGDTAERSFARAQRASDSLTMDRLASQARALAERFPAAAGALNRFARGAENASEKVKDLAAKDARVKVMGDNIARSLRGMRDSGSKNFDGLVHSVAVGTRKMLRVGGKNSEETRAQIHRQFRIAARSVQQAMDDKVISVEEGTNRLRELARKELRLYGISAGRVNVVLAKGASGQMRPHQRGGPITDGKPTGDSVPALLEKGEYVVNRRAVRKVGQRALDALNFGSAPRFQQGGIVELLHPFNDPKGHGGSNSHLHIAMLDGIVALGRRLQKLGWLVGEHPAFGGVNAGHAAGGYHYSSQAIDVNWPNAAQEAAKIRALLPMLGGSAAGGLARVFDGLARVALKGPMSVALEAGQGALDRIRGAANASIERVVGGFEGVEAGANWSGSWVDLMATISGQRGWNLADWKTLVNRESGGDPTARNPSSGAFGLGQFLGATARAYAKHGALSNNPVDQIRAMAQYISDRYGDPSAALAFHDRNNWYRAGGLVGLLQAGGPPKGFTTQAIPRLGSTLRKVTAGKSPKVRRQAVQGLLERIRGIGLPPELEAALSKHSGNAGVFAEYADRAAALTDEGAITDALQIELERRQGLGQAFPDADQQQMVDSMLGRVGGKTQLDWLTDQVGALFNWRNAVIDAEQIVVQRREQITALIERARAQLELVREQIKAAAKQRRALERALAGVRKRLEKAQEHPKRNKGLIKRLRGQVKAIRGQIGGIDRDQKPRTRMRNALKTIIGDQGSGLVGRRVALVERRGELLGQLQELQGLGAPTHRMASLPAIDVLGGQIFDARMRIKELTDKPIRVVAETAGPSESDSERAAILEGLLREANLRTAVSEKQFEVFRGVPEFAGGGVVAGPAGVAVPAVVHAGEGVFTREQMAAMGGGGQPIVVVVQDGAVREDRIKVIAGREAERITRQQARVGARGLPSRGGGLLR